jgi:glycosyltransferase involved in cell wall biosynthesis
MGSLRGGPTFAVADMTRGLAQAGVEVDVATTDDNGPERLAVPHGRPVIHDGVTYWYFRRQTNFYMFSQPLANWLARNLRNYDLVDIHYVFAHAGIPAAFYAIKHRIPYILRPHGMLNRWSITMRRPVLKRISLHLFERHMLARAAAVYLTSEQERCEVAALDLPMRPVVMPLGIDLAPFQHLPKPGQFRQQYPDLVNKMLILFLSRLHPKKGLDLLLPAFARLRQERPDVTLILAGSGDPAYEAELRTQIEALGIEQDVIFTGFVEGEVKKAVLADCDLFVLPSYSENFGIVVVEAMVSGLPVIISDRIGLASDIAEAQAGIVVPCRTEPLSEVMLSLVNDSVRRRRLATQAQQLARQRFSLERATHSLIELYQNLITPVVYI